MKIGARLDDFGRYGELKPGFLFWLVMLVLTRHTWFSIGALAAAAKVREAAVLLADFSWISVAVEVPALAVAVLALNRKPAAGALVRALWRHARWLLLFAAIGQLAFTVRQMQTIHAGADGWLGFDIAVMAAAVVSVVWLFASRHVAELIADFPAPVQPGTAGRSSSAGESAPRPPAASAANQSADADQLRQFRRPPEVVAQIERVMALFKEARYAEAEIICRQVIEREPNDPDGLHLLGCMRLSQGDAEAAIDWIARAIAVAPHVPDYHANLGIAYGERGRAADAERCARRAAELDAAALAGESGVRAP